MKMPLAFFCNAAIGDQSGRVSALGIFSSLYGSVFPMALPQITLALVVQGDDSDVGHHTAQVNFLGAPGSNIAMPVKCDFSIVNRDSAINIIINFQSLLIPTPGEYVANVVVDDGAL